jgi:hypothetical protein
MSSINTGANASTRLSTRFDSGLPSFIGHDIPFGVSVPTRYVYFIANDNSIQRAGTLGVDFSVVNPSDQKRHYFAGLLDSGSTQPVISRRIANSVGVKLYPATADPTPGAPPTAKVFHVPLEIVGFAGVFPTVVTIVPDYYPVLIPPRVFTKYYNMIFSSTDVVFTQKHTIEEENDCGIGIPITHTKHGPFIDVQLDGVNIPMVADLGAEVGSLTNATAIQLNIGRFPKIRTHNETRGPITKTIADYSVPLTIDGITYVEPMSVGIDAKSDQTDNVFPLEKLLEDGYRIMMSDSALKIIPPTSFSYV